MKKTASQKLRTAQNWLTYRNMTSTQTQEAISLAKSQINDAGMDDANAIDAACEQYQAADRKAVAKAIGEWS